MRMRYGCLTNFSYLFVSFDTTEHSRVPILGSVPVFGVASCMLNVWLLLLKEEVVEEKVKRFEPFVECSVTDGPTVSCFVDDDDELNVNDHDSVLSTWRNDYCLRHVVECISGTFYAK